MKRNPRTTKKEKKDETKGKKLKLVREIVVNHLEGVQGGAPPCSGCHLMEN